MDTNSNQLPADAYVNLSQQAASLVHHVSTPLAVARLNVDFLNRYLPALIEHHQQAAIEPANSIPAEHIQAILLAPQLIEEQLDAIQNHVKAHWQSLSREVEGQIPTYQVSVASHVKTAEKLTNSTELAKILLVEDEAIHREIAAKILSPHYDLDLAHTGEEALRCCQNTHYDLILMDLYLPGIDGKEAARQIRTTQNQESVIIGLTNTPFGTQTEDDSLNAYLSKPLTAQALKDCLTKINQVSSRGGKKP